MRGSDEGSGTLFSYVDLESRVREDHPLRVIRMVANAALADLSGDFSSLYRTSAGPRFRRRSCFGRCSFKLSMGCGRSGN